MLPNINIKNVDVGVLITPRHPKEIKQSATNNKVSVAKSTEVVEPPTQPGVPQKACEKIELSPFQQATIAQRTSEAKATALQQIIILPKHPKVTFPYLETVESQQPTLPDVTVPHLGLELTIAPEPTVEAEHPTALHPTIATSGLNILHPCSQLQLF